jgi:signal transduction histidine kinase
MEGQGVPVNFDLAKEHFQKLVEALKWDKEFYPYDVKQWVFLLAQEKLRAIEEKAANKQMLSFLTHTLINSLGNVPGTVREIIKRLGSDYEHKTKVIDKIVSLLTTFSLIDTLIQTFKLYLAEPQKFESSWYQDNQGKSNIKLVLAFALRQTVGRILFSPVDNVKKLLPSGTEINIKALRHSFMNDLITLELDHTNAEQVFQWLTQHLNIFIYELDKTEAIQFKHDGIRFTFFFSILSELIYNALKYGNGKIEISWKMAKEQHYELSCRNTFDPKRRRHSTQKGLVFVTKLMSLLKKSTIEPSEENNLFTVKLFFHKTNFEDNTHANTVN